jgi:tRNA threonylcarbamoyl adenosine modification protein YeaZ
VSILGINSALPYTEIAIVRGGKTLFYEGWKSDFNEAEKLLPALKRALKNTDKLDKIFIIEGPGSFTGLRVGITIANTIAYAEKVPLITMGTFECLHAKIPSQKQKNTAVILRAGGQNIVATLPDGKKNHNLKADELENFLSGHPDIKYIIGDIKKENRKIYAIPKAVKWLEIKDLITLDKVIRSSAKKREHKLVKPVYFKPPTITKSKFTLK